MPAEGDGVNDVSAPVTFHNTNDIQMSFSNNNSFSATNTTNSSDIFLGSYFLSFTHLENATAEFARQNGFSYVKRSTHHVSGEISRATPICSKGYIPSKAKKEGTTEVQLCPFKIAATRCATTNLLKITTLVNEHNHQPADMKVRFSARNRRLTPADMSDILELRDANSKVADILAVLTNRTSSYITNRQIYNALSGRAQKKIAGMSECSKLQAFVGSSSDLLGFYSAKRLP